jgi:hypothetical protein
MKSTSWSLCVALALPSVAIGAASVGLGACASDENATVAPPDTSVYVPPTPDASAEGGGEAEAGPCTGADCELFPTTCSPDALCPNGPFDPTNPQAGMDWRTRINVIRGRSASDVWLAGAVGAMAHFDGTSWTVSDVGTQETQRAMWLAGAGEVAFGSLQRIYTRGLGTGDSDAAVSAGGWSVRAFSEPPPDFGFTLSAAWAPPGAASLWLATDSTLWRMNLGPAPDTKLEIVPGIASSECGAVPCNRVRSIHGASTKTIWAVGELGAALRIDGADGDTPTVTQLNSLTLMGLTGVWAASDTDVWAVGGSGTIRRFTGGPLQWAVVPDVPTTENLNAVWGTSSSDVWVVGNAGVVLHFDGTSWSRLKIAGMGSRRPDLHSVWSPGAGHVWVAGYGVALSLGGKP